MEAGGMGEGGMGEEDSTEEGGVEGEGIGKGALGEGVGRVLEVGVEEGGDRGGGGGFRGGDRGRGRGGGGGGFNPTGPFAVFVNHFEVRIDSETKVHQHAVVWKDESFEAQRGRRERVIGAFMRKHPQAQMFYDGDKLIWADRELPHEHERSMEIKPTGKVLSWGRVYDPDTPHDEKLQILNSINTMLNSVLLMGGGGGDGPSSSSSSPSSSSEAALVCTKRAGAFFPHRADYLFPIDAPHRPRDRHSQGWFGFRTSIGLVRLGGQEVKLTMCLNAATAIAVGQDRERGTLSLRRFMEDLMGKRVEDFTPADEDRLSRHPSMRRLGLICRAKKKKQNFKAFEPSNGFCRAGNNVFELQDGSKQSVAQYFTQLAMQSPELGIPLPIEDDEPLVRMHSGKRDIFIPLKCCEVDPFQCPPRPMQEEKDAINKEALMKPWKRKDKNIQTVRDIFASSVGGGGGGVFERFGVTINTQMQQVTARVLPAAPLQLQSREGHLKTLGEGNMRERASWNMQGNMSADPAGRGKPPLPYCVIDFDPQMQEGERVWMDLKRALKDEHAILLDDRGPVFVIRNRWDFGGGGSSLQDERQEAEFYRRCQETMNSLRGQLTTEYQRLEESKHPKPAYAFVFVPGSGNDEQPRALIKTVLDRRLPNNVMIKKKAQKGGIQYASNIGLKVNIKMGGRNWWLDPNSEKSPAMKVIQELFRKEDLAVIGADVTHPTGARGGSNVHPSFVGMVASSDEQLATWTHSARAQTGKTEVIVDFGQQLNECLWARPGPDGRRRTRPPRHLIVVRDGVSDAQIQHVIDDEVRQIKELYRSYGAEYEKGLRLTVVCIQKRHNMRGTVAEGGGDGQLPPGTFLESFENIMLPQGCRGFWLCPHKGLIGTSHPSLCVLTEKRAFQEDGHLSEEALLHFLYHLCSLCQRATKTVSYAVPALYADHLAERAEILCWPLRPQWRQRSKELVRKKGQPRAEAETAINMACVQAAREANDHLKTAIPSAGVWTAQQGGGEARTSPWGLNFFL
uniref:Piwi domain-containing protein n=1 Tax=Chromera velia CCMP2878 TaxID=1169474 RepID=A0A0G4GZG0_9ALVE